MPGLRNDRVLDPTDRKLLALLRANARASATSLGKQVGLSRTAVQERLARLERDGVILGYTAVFGASEATPGLRAVLSVNISRRPCAPVLALFKGWPEIVACYSTAGPVDAVVLAEVGGADELSLLVDRLSGLPGVGRVEAAVILASIIEPATGSRGHGSGAVPAGPAS